MKAVVLAAGEGLRCRPLTLTYSKVMLPVANRPILEYVIRSLSENNIKDIILIVGYKKERIMDYFGDGIDFGVNITYVEQKAQLGTAHAIKQAQPFINENFLVLNGDNLIESKTISDLLSKASGDVTILTVIREQTLGYGVVILDKNRVLRILEKPKEVVSHFVNTGIYMFSPIIFEEIDKTPISSTGEYAITDTIQRIIEQGKKVKHVNTNSMWLDAAYSWDLLKANAIMLGRLKGNIKGNLEKNAIIVGDVEIGENTIIRSGCYIVGPVIIGENCDIGPNTTILPSTSIGDNCRIGSFTEIENSIIMNDVRIGVSSHISNSIIGNNNVIGSHFITEVGKNLKIEIKNELHHAEELGSVIGDENTIGESVLVVAGKMIATGCSIASGVKVYKDIPQNSIVM